MRRYIPCERCGKLFLRYDVRSKQARCPDCRTVHDYICALCGATFTRRNQSGSHTYCSKECARKAQNRNHQRWLQRGTTTAREYVELVRLPDPEDNRLLAGNRFPAREFDYDVKAGVWDKGTVIRLPDGKEMVLKRLS